MQLTITDVPEIFDKTIRWTSSQDDIIYGGIAIIKDLRASSNPLIADVINGDDLNKAATYNDEDVCFPTIGGIIFYEILE